MSPARRRATLIGIVVAGFALHAGLGGQAALFGARPDIALCFLLLACLYAGPSEGAGLGFLLGLLEGSYTPVFLGSLIVTHSLAGFTVGSLEDRIFRDNLLIAIIVVALGTPFVEGCFYLFAPRPDPAAWAAQVAGTTLYNSLLAIPLFFLVRRLLRPRS